MLLPGPVITVVYNKDWKIYVQNNEHLSVRQNKCFFLRQTQTKNKEKIDIVKIPFAFFNNELIESIVDCAGYSL